jgi:hypothetical protein
MRLWNRTIEQMGPEGREVLSRRPPQDEAMGVVLSAWEDLSTCRPVGMTEGWIPWDKAKDWGIENGLDVEERRLLWAVIHRLDVEEMDRRAFERRTPDRPAALAPRR